MSAARVDIVRITCAALQAALTFASLNAVAADVTGTVKLDTGGVPNNTTVLLVPADTDDGSAIRATEVAADGRFRVSDVPDGRYTLRVTGLGGVEDTQPIGVTDGRVDRIPLITLSSVAAVRQLDDLVITGTPIRDAQAQSLARQQDAPNKTEVVSSDLAGQFPDVTAAESLSRLPGVAASRDRGRPARIQVRGMPERWTTVSYDGLNVIGSEGRVVRFDEIPSPVISELSLAKTLTPDMSAESVAGAVDIVTRSALDQDRPFLDLSASGGYNDVSDDSTGSYSARAGWRNDAGTIGILGVASLDEAQELSDGFELERIADEDNPEQIIPNQLEQENNLFPREVTGFNFRLDLDDLIDGHKFTLSSLSLENHTGDIRHEVAFLLGDAGGSSNVTASSGNFENVPVLALGGFGSTVTKTDTHTFAGRSDLFGGALDYRLNITDTSRITDLPIVLTLALTAQSGRTLDATLADGETTDPTITYSEPDETQPLTRFPQGESFGLDLFAPFIDVQRTAGRAARIDFERYTDLFGLGWLTGFGKIGVGFDERDQSGVLPTAPASIIGVSAAAIADNLAGFTPASGLLPPIDVGLIDAAANAGGVPSFDFAPFVTNERIRTAVPRDVVYNYNDNAALTDAGARAARDLEGSAFSAAIGQAGLFSDEVPAGSIYRTQERIYSAYAMHTSGFAWGDVIWGARAEFVEFAANGFRQDGDGAVMPAMFHRDELDIFPSINTRIDVWPDTVLRVAFTTATARPSFSELRPGFFVDNNDELVIRGNPELAAEDAIGLDVGLEWYNADASVLSVAVFAKRVDNVIAQTLRPNQEPDGFPIMQPDNGSDGLVYGIEFSVQQTADAWLSRLGAPAWLNTLLTGFGINSNLALLDSEFTTPPGVDGATRTSRLPGTSDTVVNSSIFWERFGGSIRLSHQYRTERLEILDAADLRFDEGRGDDSRLSLTASYAIPAFGDRFSVFAQGDNLTDAAETETIGQRYLQSAAFFNGRRFLAGLRGSF